MSGVDDTFPRMAQASQTMATALVAPLMAGWVVNLLVLGMFLNAFSTYYQARGRVKRDGKVVTVVLWSVLFFELVYVAINLEELFHMADYQKRDSITLVSAGYMFSFQPIFAGLVQLIVQSFLTYRASGLFQNRNQKFAFFAVMGIVIGASLAGTALVSGLGFMTYYGMDLPIQYGAATALWLWSSAATDVLVTTALYYNLNSRISGFSSSTDSMLRKIGRIGVRTAAYTAIVALMGAIVSVAIPLDSLKLTNVPCAFFLPMPSLYAFSLFTTINSRETIAATGGMLSDSDGNKTRTHGGFTNSRVPPGGLSIHVAEEIAVELSEPNTGWSRNEKRMEDEGSRV